MGQRQHMHRGADLDALGARGDLAGDIHRRRQHRAARLLVDFGQPEDIEPPAVGGLDLLEALVERIGVALAFDLAMKLMIPAEFHGGFLDARRCTDAVSPRPAAGIAQIPMFDPPHNVSA